MNYIYSKAKKGELVTFFNKNRFIPKYAKFGNLTNEGGRPYHVIFFEEYNTEYKYIIINIHNKHNTQKDEKEKKEKEEDKKKLENSINNDIFNCLKLSGKSQKLLINKDTSLTKLTNIKKYIEDEHDFKVIMMGDFNDHGSNYWEGLTLINNIIVSSKKPPLTCCSTNRKTDTKEHKISDYILINSKLSFIKMCNIAENFEKNSDIFPTSDHLPIEATII